MGKKVSIRLKIIPTKIKFLIRANIIEKKFPQTLTKVSFTLTNVNNLTFYLL